jgi:surface protein
MAKKWMIIMACLLAVALTACAFTERIPSGATDSLQTTATSALTEPSWQTNILRSDMIAYQSENNWEWSDEAAQYPVFGSEYTRAQIRSITFVNSLSEAPRDAWDVSALGDYAVRAWVEPEGSGYNLYIGADGGINASQACADLFAGYHNLRWIDFGQSFHTDGATDMSRMFLGCESLTSLDLPAMETGEVFGMDMMFAWCRSLESLDVKDFDTACVMSMQQMFYYCDSLTELDLSGWDTGNVVDMSSMFGDCHSLKSLNLDGLETGNVLTMSGIFHSCEALEILDLSSFDTARVKDMWGMFCFCKSLNSLDISSFDTRNVTTMNSMFSGCKALEDIKLDHFDTSNVTDMMYMFLDCPCVTVDDVRHFNTDRVKVNYNFMSGTDWWFLFE